MEADHLTFQMGQWFQAVRDRSCARTTTAVPLATAVLAHAIRVSPDASLSIVNVGHRACSEKSTGHIAHFQDAVTDHGPVNVMRAEPPRSVSSARRQPLGTFDLVGAGGKAHCGYRGFIHDGRRRAVPGCGRCTQNNSEVLIGLPRHRRRRPGEGRGTTELFVIAPFRGQYNTPVLSPGQWQCARYLQ